MRVTVNILIFIIISFSVFSQKVDSLKLVIKNSKADSTRIDAYIEIAKVYKSKQPDSALIYLDKALSESKRTKYIKGEGNSNFHLGSFYRGIQKSDTALKYYNRAIDIWTAQGDTNEICKSLTHLGNMYNNLGNFSEAVKYYNRALEMSAAAKIWGQAGSSLFNLGTVYKKIGILSKALDYFIQARDMFEKDDRLAASINMIGILYMEWQEYDKALENFKQSLKLEESKGNKQGMADVFINIGTIFIKQQKEKDAIESYEKAQILSVEIEDKNKEAFSILHIALAYTDMYDFAKADKYIAEIVKSTDQISQKDVLARIFQGIGYCYLIQGKCSDAMSYLERSLEIAQASGLNDITSTCYLFLSHASICQGDGKKSADYYKKYDKSKEESNKIMNDARVQFETAQKEREILLMKEQQETSKKLIKAQRQAIYIFIAGLVAIVIFLFIVFNQYRQKKKANIILAQQKKFIEEQKKEIEDSITYAKRIQEAVISLNDTAGTFLEKSFVLFRPKSVVSGDFYWATEVGDWQIVTVADCTGHGVPGAFMSMLGVSFLTEIVRKKEINTASEILDDLRKYIIDALKQRGRLLEQKDGMDISLCAINKVTLECQFAGANNPIYIIRAKKDQQNTGSYELTELKGDKMPVAIYERMNNFTNHKIQLEKGDRLYMFSDGFADQFGGENGRKFMYKSFKNLLVNTANQPINDQYNTLTVEFEKWLDHTDKVSGNNYEQIDDVTVMGVEI